MILLVTSFIYVSVGTEIYRNQKQLRNLASQSRPTFQSMKKVEVRISSQPADIFCGAAQDRPEDGSFLQGREFLQYTANISSADHSHATDFHVLNSGAQTSSSDAAAWAYAKCAMLFFAALIITWVIEAADIPELGC
jgi:hypothetical protein